MQAVLATVLRLPLEEVPHFLEASVGDDWWDQMNVWLMSLAGVALIGLTAGEWNVPAVLHLSQGLTVRGSEHVVVSFAGRTIWDPHPSRAGLTEVRHHELFVTTPKIMRESA